jgi:hypothetical protein
MKKTILILAILTSISPWAQSDPVLPAAGQSYAASSANPRLPWWFANPPSASQSSIYANQSGANLTTSDLGARLANLQNDLQQVLPLVASFNANLQTRNQKPSEPESEAAANVPAPIPAPTGANFSTNYGQNFSTRASANYSQNFSSPVGYTPPSPASASGFSVVVPPTAPASANPFGPPQVPAASGENEAVAPISTSEAVRQLLTLQADIQRLLPVVASLNSGGLNLASGLVPENLNNSFVTATNRFYSSPTGSQQPTLTPTGR